MPVAGKAELDKSDWLKTEHMKDAPKMKRACSNILDLTAANSVVGIIYTSTAITISRIILYRITATVGTTGAVDVGIDGDDDAIINAHAIAAGLIDTAIQLSVSDGSVAADKVVTASVETVVGTSGTVIFCIEYTEDN